MLIGSDNQLIVISLDEYKIEEIDNVNEFTTLKDYFMVISSDLQTTLYRQMGRKEHFTDNSHLTRTSLIMQSLSNELFFLYGIL